MAYDSLLLNGQLMLPQGVSQADLAIAEGKIVEIGRELAGTARDVLDVTGLHVFPGVIDAHVHFNEPGRIEWEGVATGSAALAAGGGTCFFDMPLNASPPTLDAASFDLKLAAMQAGSHTDFALWGGLVPGNAEQLEELAERGVVGYKAFMAASGIDDFVMADDDTLQEGMQIAARLKLPVAVHAENDTITSGLAKQAMAAGRIGVRDFLASRPVEAELEAITRAIQLTKETGCSLHIVHVSTGRGVALVVEARARGVDVTCETCPHYLVLTAEDVERLGAVAKCAPPLRSAEDQSALWSALLAGDVAFVASDHSPAPPSMKQSSDFFQVWGGITGCQTLLGLLLHEGHQQRGLPFARLAELTSGSVADRFRIARKGRLEVGFDADFTLVDLSTSPTLRESDLRYRHRLSPYLGRTLGGEVRKTLVRGQTVFRDGQIVGTSTGQLVRPSSPASVATRKPS